MIRCEICGALYHELPTRRICQLQPDGYRETLYETKCLYCESPHLIPFDPYAEEEEKEESHERDRDPV